jgi:hypothetical protein
MLARLSQLSTDDGTDAFEDVDWDAPTMRLDPDDPRHELWSVDPLARTDWYASLSADLRREVGRDRMATALRIGWEFENILQRGLLALAYRMRNHDPRFRYLHHEVIEESQHTLMFSELITRLDADPTGMSGLVRFLGDTLPDFCAKHFPSLFFLMVLGGELPIDHLQRVELRQGDLAPIVHRILSVHVHEESRHVSFARHHLEHDVPKLGPIQRHLLAVLTPVVYGIMTRVMVAPSRAFLDAHDVPRAVRRDVRRSPEMRQLLRDAIARGRRIAIDTGQITPVSKLIWKAFGIWDEKRRR